MPGISLKYDIRKLAITKHEYDLFLKALDSTVYNGNYKQEILLKDQNFMLASTRYPEYPIRIFDGSESNFWICIEGKIYGKEDSVIKNELEELLNLIFTTNLFNTTAADANGDDHKLVSWLLKTDGEFIVYALDKKTKEFVIINDVLGRLPFYYHYDTNFGLIISRELQFMMHFLQEANSSKFDRMAVAQHLLFGYPLGKRILFEDVFRVLPASLIRTNNNKLKENQFQIDILHTFNFDDRLHTNQDLKKDAAELVSLFSDACKNRAVLDGRNNIISLSGGFDSRCVAACLFNNKVPFSAITYVEPGWLPALGKSSEVEIAEQLANKFGIEWEKYGPFEPKSKNMINLLKIKQGAAYLGYGFILSFLEELRERYDSLEVAFFTGEGRETVMPDFIHSRKFQDLNDLVRHIISRKGNFSLSDISAITQIKECELINEIRNTISAYPEKNLNQKYVHFVIYETAFKGIFEIEDKDRYYFWSVSPFYSIPFFEYAVGCDASNKPFQALYREFLLQLSPLAASIEKADYGAAIISHKYKITLLIQTLIYRYHYIKKIINKIMGKKYMYYDIDSKVIRCLQDQIGNCEPIASCLSRTMLRHIVNNPTKYSRRSIDLLFTVTSLIEKIHSCESSISRYYV